MTPDSDNGIFAAKLHVALRKFGLDKEDELNTLNNVQSAFGASCVAKRTALGAYVFGNKDVFGEEMCGHAVRVTAIALKTIVEDEVA